ncbi:hypothetical protein [Virgibacillus sp. YIM 98842]|uniref:hypothetical protein n=1 Tax=Virgibacillus sp. YIM 98842 TaxID=2663533 RepID=UPI0013DCAE88|nr:hypothetical protein [Virgibacillus sp. YIM 98842]
MSESISMPAFKTYIEKKLKKKIIIKVIWNDQGKLTLFTTPNMKISSFIYDEREGYLFYDQDGKEVNDHIPCILAAENLIDGQIKLDSSLRINGAPLTKEEKTFLKKEGSNDK